MIEQGTEVYIRATPWRVEGFRNVDGVLWVELEEARGRWPQPKAMVLFSELAPIVLNAERESARDAYAEREAARRGLHLGGMGSTPDPLPDDFWDGFQEPGSTVAVITVPSDKLEAVADALRGA